LVILNAEGFASGSGNTSEQSVNHELTAMPLPTFHSAAPYQDDVLALPVTDLDAASAWYSKHFGMTEVDRIETPVPTVILQRNGVRLGFAINGGDASQDGAAIRVTNIGNLRKELDAKGTPTMNWRIDSLEGEKHQVFFVVAPDGLCFYFHEPLA
jgi:catechol 2,3-dioxygenase-like lactoylglutathione lyase family enzyme